jgi:competence protein ComEC
MKRVFAHIGFAFAIALLVLNIVNVKYILIIAVGLAIIFVTSLLLPKYRQALTVPICIGSALFACLVFLIVYNGSVTPQRELDFKSAQSSFYIIDVAQQSGDNYIYTVKTTSIDDEGAPQNIKLRLKTTEEIDAKPYQIVDAKLTFYTIGDNALDSYGYWGDNIFLSSNADDVNVTDEFISSPWHYVLNLRIDIINTIYSNIKSDEGALAVALLTGYRGLLSDEVYDNFKYAGATHLMAVSGLHLVVVTGAILLVLKKLKVNDKVNIFATLFVILVYIGVAGFSKSIVRAGIMMAVMLVAKLFKRRGDSLNSLGLAVFIICLNPFAVYDVSAMLSVLSVLSLITLYPVLMKCVDKNSIVETDGLVIATMSKKLIAKFLTSFFIALSILIYTLPAMYLYYGSVNFMSLVSNIVLVPMGSFAMILCLVSYVAIKLKLTFFAFIARYWNRLILLVVKLFASFKHSLFVFDDNFWMILVVVLLAFAICFILNNKRLMKVVGVICAIGIICSGVISTVYYNDRDKILITENSSVVIADDGKAVIYGLDDESDYYSIYNFLFINRYDVDTMIVTGNNYDYAVKLIDVLGCDTVVMASFSDEIMQNTTCKNIIVGNEYNNSISDNLLIEYQINSDGECFTSKIFDTTLFISDDFISNCDIICNNDTINDSNGSIDLSDGDIIYTVCKDNFSVRRG